MSGMSPRVRAKKANLQSSAALPVPLEPQYIDILTAMDHPDLFARWFQGESWDGWRVFLAALFGLP
jgi:hypothetical protein